MCKDCGCEEANKKYFDDRDHGHDHGHGHHHDHGHKHDHNHNHDHEVKLTRTINLEKNVLEKNDEIAHKNYHWFDDHKMKVVNLISSPGSGKTMLLEKTIQHLNERKTKFAILVGDQQTDHDAQRLLDKGAAVKQINTYTSCHLDAAMIERELGGFVSGEEELLIIENIGNLVCPAAFDLGEHQKIALLSTTEGEDKPIKYPVLFSNAQLVVITKSDLMPHLDWSLEKTKNYIRAVNPKAKILLVSARTGEGVAEFVDYLLQL